MGISPVKPKQNSIVSNSTNTNFNKITKVKPTTAASKNVTNFEKKKEIIEKGKNDGKTERPHKKISAPLNNNLNASWILTLKDKKKDNKDAKEGIKNQKLNMNKSPIKPKKRNSKTPKNNMSKKNLLDEVAVGKSKQIDKVFLQSLTGNLQSLISNIEVIEKVGKKNNEVLLNVK